MVHLLQRFAPELAWPYQENYPPTMEEGGDPGPKESDIQPHETGKLTQTTYGVDTS